MTQLKLLGVPMEEGAGRRGCVMGPAAYRTAGLVEELRAIGYDVTDFGDEKPELVDRVHCSREMYQGDFLHTTTQQLTPLLSSTYYLYLMYLY